MYSYLENANLVSIPDYFDWRRENQAFDGLAAWNFQYFTLSGTSQPERVQGLKVTADFFNILGVSSARAAAASRRKTSSPAGIAS